MNSDNPKPSEKRPPEAEFPPLPRGVREELERMSGRILDARWFLGRALTALAAGDWTEALAEAEHAKRVAPRSPTVRETLGVAAYRAGDFKQALSELQAFRRLAGTKLHDLKIADCYRAEGRPLRAVEFLDEIKAPNIGDAARVRAGALHDAGDSSGAAAALEVAGLTGEPVKAPGFVPPGTLGSAAARRRKT